MALHLRGFWNELEKFAETPLAAGESVGDAYRGELRRLASSGRLKDAKRAQRWTGSKALTVVPSTEHRVAIARGAGRAQKFFGKLKYSKVRGKNQDGPGKNMAAGGALGATAGAGIGGLYHKSVREVMREEKAKFRHWGPGAEEAWEEGFRSTGGPAKVRRVIQAGYAVPITAGVGVGAYLGHKAWKNRAGKKKTSGVASWAAKNKEHLIHGAEIGGLGVLGVPSYKNLRNPKSTDKEKRHAKYELAGLGILGVPSAIGLAHSAYRKFKPAVAKAPGLLR